MIAKLRDKRFWIHGTVAGKFLRLPLGTENKDAAKMTVKHVEWALSEGATSLRWQELKKTLPPKTFDKLAKIGSYVEPKPEPEAPPAKTWDDLEKVFLAKLELRIQTEDMAESTRERYKQTLRSFKAFLDRPIDEEKGERRVYDLPSMDTPFIEKFKLWRLGKIQEKKSPTVDVALQSMLLSCIEHSLLLSGPNWLPKIRRSLTDDLAILASMAHIPFAGTS